MFSRTHDKPPSGRGLRSIVQYVPVMPSWAQRQFRASPRPRCNDAFDGYDLTRLGKLPRKTVHLVLVILATRRNKVFRVMGRHPTTSTMPRATPTGRRFPLSSSMIALFEAQMTRGPRQLNGFERHSMVFSPMTICEANGWRTDKAFISCTVFLRFRLLKKSKPGRCLRPGLYFPATYAAKYPASHAGAVISAGRGQGTIRAGPGAFSGPGAAGAGRASRFAGVRTLAGFGAFFLIRSAIPLPGPRWPEAAQWRLLPALRHPGRAGY